MNPLNKINHPLRKNQVVKHRIESIGLSWLLDWEKVQLGIGLFIIGILALSPVFIKSPYYLGIIILTVLYAYVGMSWNIVGGMAGQLLMGHVTFFGLGAYTTIILLERFGVSPWLGFIASAIAAGLLGLFFSLLTLRYGLKIDYFALFTLAVMTIAAIVFSQLEITGGPMGIYVTTTKQSLEKMVFTSKSPYLYIILSLLLAVLIFTYMLFRSRMGKYFMAIREDELAAAALGVNVGYYKTIATIITACLEGVGGGFYVMYTTIVEPPVVFNLSLNVQLLTAPLIGGLGSLIGPIFGAILNKPIVELLRGALSGNRAGTELIIYGLFLISFVLFLPEGVNGMLQRAHEKFRIKQILKLKR